MIKRVRLLMGGDVQGVGFRWHCRREASARGIGGFVRNLADGRVEAVVEGDAEAVAAMVEWCRRGPPAARVTSFEAEERQPEGENAFRVAR